MVEGVVEEVRSDTFVIGAVVKCEIRDPERCVLHVVELAEFHAAAVQHEGVLLVPGHSGDGEAGHLAVELHRLTLNLVLRRSHVMVDVRLG